MEQFKEDYKMANISAKDIFLPPFKDGLTNEEIEQGRYNYITQAIEEEKKQGAAISKKNAD